MGVGDPVFKVQTSIIFLFLFPFNIDIHLFGLVLILNPQVRGSI